MTSLLTESKYSSLCELTIWRNTSTHVERLRTHTHAPHERERDHIQKHTDRETTGEQPALFARVRKNKKNANARESVVVRSRTHTHAHAHARDFATSRAVLAARQQVHVDVTNQRMQVACPEERVLEILCAAALYHRHEFCA